MATNDVTPRKILANSSVGKKQISSGFRGSSSRTFGSVTTATQFRGSSQSSINISGLQLGHNRQSKTQNRSTSNIVGDSIGSGSGNVNVRQTRSNGKRSFNQSLRKQQNNKSKLAYDLSPYVESNSKSITGRTSRSFVLEQSKQLIDQKEISKEEHKKSQLELLSDQLIAQKQDNMAILRDIQMKVQQLKEEEVEKWKLRTKNNLMSRKLEQFQANLRDISKRKVVPDSLQQDQVLASNLLQKIRTTYSHQHAQVNQDSLINIQVEISKLQSVISTQTSPQTIFTRLSNIPCLLQIKQPSKINTRAVIVLSSSQSSTGFVIKYGANKISLSQQLNRLFFDSQRNQLILKRGQKFEEQLQSDGQIRRSVIVRLKGGALFPRSRILLTIRSQCASSLNKTKYELKDYMQSKIKEILVQFREKRYMLNYTQLLFLRNSFYDELLDIKMKDFAQNLQNPIWNKLIMFLENSAVITRAYICAMQQTTVLKPELRFFENRFIGKDFNLYTNSEYDEEEIAQEVMAITGRRIDIDEQQQGNYNSRMVADNQKIKVQDGDEDYNEEDLDDQDELQIFKQKNLSKKLIAKEEKGPKTRVNEDLLNNKINGEKLLKLTDAVENQSQNTNNYDTNLCFQSTNQIGQYLTQNQLIRIENGEEEEELEQSKSKIGLSKEENNESLKQFMPRGLLVRDKDKNQDDEEQQEEDQEDQEEQIDLGTIQDNEEELKPYISQSWGGMRGNKIFTTSRNQKYNQKTPVSQRYQNIQIDSTSSSIQYVRSSSQNNDYSIHVAENQKTIEQNSSQIYQSPSKIAKKTIAQRDTLVMDLQNYQIKQSSIQFDKVIKEGGKVLNDLALQALIHKDFNAKYQLNNNNVQGIQALAVNTARITHSEQSAKLNQQQSQADENQEDFFQSSQQYDDDNDEEDQEDKLILQKEQTQKLEKIKKQIEQQQRRQNKALRLQLEDAHNFQYIPNYTQKTNTLFPGTNRSQFTVIALQTPKCIPIQLLQQKTTQENSSNKSPTVRQFFKPQTQEPDNPFLQFNFFYRYTSNAPRFTRAKKQQDDDNQEIKEVHKPSKNIVNNDKTSPQARIHRAQRKSSFSNQKILAIKCIQNFKLIAVKIQGENKQSSKIVILTEQNIKSLQEENGQQLVTKINTDKIMNTIMTDQAINLGSPIGAGGQKGSIQQSQQVSKDEILTIDLNWLNFRNLKGYSSLKDVERKIEKFIQLLNLKGMIHFHKQQNKHHKRYNSNFSKSNKQRKLIST